MCACMGTSTTSKSRSESSSSLHSSPKSIAATMGDINARPSVADFILGSTDKRNPPRCWLGPLASAFKGRQMQSLLVLSCAREAGRLERKGVGHVRMAAFRLRMYRSRLKAGEHTLRAVSAEGAWRIDVQHKTMRARVEPAHTKPKRPKRQACVVKSVVNWAQT